ncbi:ankyrin repeat domain-containing protein [Lacinutrix undariae]
MNFKTIITTVTLFLGLTGFAQDNVFLSRDFWDSKPTVKIVKEKIKEGHNIAESNGNNFDPVVYAILQGVDTKVIKYIQSRDGNDVNKLTHDGRTYIFWAAYKGNIEVMEYLLKEGAKTDITDDKGNTILNFAAASGQKNTEVYELCLENGANLKTDLNPDGANALLISAAADKEMTLLDYFTSKGLDLNSTDAKGNDIFNYVARSGDIERLNKLRGMGAKGSDQAFLFAAYGERRKTNGIEVYEYLNGLGFNLKASDKDGVTPFHIVASRNKDLNIINFFLSGKANVNAKDNNGNTPFLNAAKHNDIKVVRELFTKVSDINLVNKKGESAVSLAVADNTSEVVRFLIENKADIAVVDAKGNNIVVPLMASFSAKKTDDFKAKIKLLEAEGVAIDKQQRNGNTLYHLAVAENNLQLIQCIVNYKVDINAKNAEGNTPLLLAAMTAKNTKILEYLLSKGASKKATTDFGETAYDLALENEILEAKQIDINFLK